MTNTTEKNPSLDYVHHNQKSKKNTLDIYIFQAQTCNRSGLGGNFIVDGVQALGAGAVEVEPPVADEVLLDV